MSNVTISAEQKGLADRHLDELYELVEALDASSTSECVSCGESLGGLLGTFQWGIINGHGECGGCGFPYVYYHRHEIEPGETLVLKAWVPNAEMPLAQREPAGRGTA